MTSPKDLLIRLVTGIPALLLGFYFRDFFRTSAGIHTFIIGASVSMFVGLWIAGRKGDGAVWFALACGIATGLTLYTTFFAGNAYAGVAVFVGLGCLGHYTGFFRRFSGVSNTDPEKKDP